MAKLETIEGIGPATAEKLEAAGIGSCEALLKAGGTKAGRSELAESTGISESRVLNLVHRADLMRVKGIGGEYSELLDVAGVDSVLELAQRNPKNLLETLESVNAEKKLVRSLPSEDQLAGWIDSAKELPRAIEH